MDLRDEMNLQHKGRLRQVPIYLRKFFRMFLYMDDWKVIPMAAIIASLVAFIAAKNIGNSMEGTMKGALAVSCICIWNGFFNSIQVVCREREIIKREHRNGMHISAYIMSHVLYQAFLCLLQVIVTVVICRVAKLNFPVNGFLFRYFDVEFGLLLFLITFSADMLALFISCIARNTTAAMTVMPFILIFELLFSGEMFGLPSSMSELTNVSLAKWGMQGICAELDYNHLPMVTVWNQIAKFEHFEVEGNEPVHELMKSMEENNQVEEFNLYMGSTAQIPMYAKTVHNIISVYSALILAGILFIFLSILILERIDHDKR